MKASRICQLFSSFCIVLPTLFACGSEDGAGDQTRVTAAALPAGDAEGSAAAASVLFTIPFPDGEPASVFWHADSRTLYIADNLNNQLWTWDDAAGLQRLATTADPAGALQAGATNVGQIARAADGTLIVARFGQPGGGYGAIAYLQPDLGTTGLVPNLDEARKRLGIDVAPDGRIFGSYFQGMPGSGPRGAVTLVDLASGERDYATGFQKIIGVLAVGDELYISDQQADRIYVLPTSGELPEPGAYRVFATLPRPDQICAGPDGSIFTGQFQAAPDSSEPIAVRQILSDGSIKRFAEDPDVSRPSGVAYDVEQRRLFVANGGNPTQQYVRVFNVP